MVCLSVATPPEQQQSINGTKYMSAMIPLELVLPVPVIGGHFATHFLVIIVILSVTLAPLIGLSEASLMTISNVSKTCLTQKGLEFDDDVRVLVANRGVGMGAAA